MKRFALLAFSAAFVCAQSPAVRSVYILPMSGGLDQYLAERMTHDHVMQVVVNPKSADAVLTDRLGEGLEQQLDRIYPPAKDDASKKTTDPHPSFRSGVAKGTIFLVDAKSRQVLWSDYEKPSRATPAREAERIAKKLQAFGK